MEFCPLLSPGGTNVEDKKTNFTQDDVKSLGETRFVMNKQHIHPQILFGGNFFCSNKSTDKCNICYECQCHGVHSFE